MSVFEMDAYETFNASREGQLFIVVEQCEQWFVRVFNLDPERVRCSVVERFDEKRFAVRVTVLDYAGQETHTLRQNELMTIDCVLRDGGIVDAFRLRIGKMDTRLHVREPGPFDSLAEKQVAWVANEIALGELLATREDRRMNVYYA